MKPSFVRVTTWTQALDLLRVRNEGAYGMTGRTTPITEAEQERFFADQLGDDGAFEAYVLYDGKEAAGFGLLKRDGDKKWMTTGLAAAYRGRGVSRVIFALITEIAYADPCEVWIEVIDSNIALFNDIRIGYQFVSSYEDDQGRLVHVMRHVRDRVLRDQERSRIEAGW